MTTSKWRLSASMAVVDVDVDVCSIAGVEVGEGDGGELCLI